MRLAHSFIDGAVDWLGNLRTDIFYFGLGGHLELYQIAQRASSRGGTLSLQELLPDSNEILDTRCSWKQSRSC